MVKIPQHGFDRALFDIPVFFKDIDEHFHVEEWEIEIPWCLKKTPNGFEDCEFKLSLLTDSEFRKAYANVYQTIDGSFSLKSSGSVIATLHAFDSTFWEISSNPNFEQYLTEKYGEFHPA